LFYPEIEREFSRFFFGVCIISMKIRRHEYFGKFYFVTLFVRMSMLFYRINLDVVSFFRRFILFVFSAIEFVFVSDVSICLNEWMSGFNPKEKNLKISYKCRDEKIWAYYLYFIVYMFLLTNMILFFYEFIAYNLIFIVYHFFIIKVYHFLLPTYLLWINSITLRHLYKSI
jgi:hypothetical protein